MTLEGGNPNVHSLRYGDKEIILVGTAHVSRESVDLVDAVIREVNPDGVCVELCKSRFQSIMQKERWQDMDIVKVIKEKKTFLLLANLLMASFQRKIAEKFGVKPGEEMIRAVETADELGVPVHLADREINITLGRTWRSMGFMSKVKLMLQLIMSIGDADDVEEEDIERMKQEDVLQTVLADVEKSHPMIRRILIDERDQYLCERIRTAPGNRIVAVVGAGHVTGIKNWLDKPIDCDELDHLPPKSRFASAMGWIIPLAIVAMIGVGFFFKGGHAGTSMVGMWVAATGILGGLGALAAFAHPLTILSAIVASPFTAIHPLIAAGWVSGLTEAWVRKPKVRDLEELSQDILSVRGFWRNKVTRILLVVVFTNIGTSFGTLVALPLLYKMMG